MTTLELPLSPLDDEYHEYVEHLLKQFAASHWIAPRLHLYQGMQAELLTFTKLLQQLGLNAETSSRRRVMFFIQGDGGLGKSSLLAELLRHSAEQQIPALLIRATDSALLDDLSRCADDDARQLRLGKELQHRTDFTLEDWQNSCKARRALLLIDGVNEIARQSNGDARTQALMQVFLGFRGQSVAVSRHVPTSVLDEQKNHPRLHILRLTAFSDAEIRHYLAHRSGAEAADLYTAIAQRGMLGLAGIPFLLRCMVDMLRAGQHDLPQARVLLLQQGMQQQREHYRAAHARTLPDEVLYFQLIYQAARQALHDREHRLIRQAALAARLDACAIPHWRMLTQAEQHNWLQDFFNAYFLRHASEEHSTHAGALDCVEHQHDLLVQAAIALSLPPAEPAPAYGVRPEHGMPGLAADWLGLALHQHPQQTEARQHAIEAFFALCREAHCEEAGVEGLAANASLLSVDEQTQWHCFLLQGLSTPSIQARILDTLPALAWSQLQPLLVRWLVPLRREYGAKSVKEAFNLARQGKLNAANWKTLQKRHARHHTGKIQRPALPPSSAATEQLRILQDVTAPAYARGAAAKKLGQIGSASENVIDALVHTLQHDTDPMNRGAAANALGQIGSASENVIDALVHTLRADNVRDDVRGSAANALGQIGSASENVIDALVHTLRADNSADNVRGSAANALGQIGSASENVIDALVHTLRADNVSDAVRGSAANALGQIGSASENVIDALVHTLRADNVSDAVRGSAANALGQIGSASENVIDALVHTLRADNVRDDVRGSAANALGQIGSASENVIDALVHTLRADNVRDDVRGSAANALGQIGSASENVIDALVHTLRADNSADNVRGSAANALGQIGSASENVIDALVHTLRADNVSDAVRGSAANALGQIGSASENVIDALVHTLRADNSADNVRGSAANALGQIGSASENVIDALVHTLRADNVSDAVRGSAANALGQIGSASENVIDALVHTLRADNVSDAVRGSAANALGQIGSASENVIDALVHTLRADNSADNVRGSAANALRRLDKFKKDIVKQLLQAVSATSNQGLRTVFARTLWAQAQQAERVQQDSWVWERIQHTLRSWPSGQAEKFASMLVRLTAYAETSKPLVQFSRHAAAEFAAFASFRQRADQEFAQMMQLQPSSSPTPRRVLLITVTENEQRTVLAALKARGVVVEEKFSQHWQGYSLAWPDGEKRSLEGYLVRQDEQRATDAASRLKDWLNTLQPDAVLMVGMCLGLPDQLTQGDVVVPSEVVSLAHVRETPDGAQPVPHVYKTRDMPMRRVQQLLAAGGWPEDYRISTKQLGCSSIKLEDPDGQTFQALLRYSPDVVAYEMEGEGFFHALKDFTGEALLIKGVADHGDFSASQGLPPDEKARQKAEAQKLASGHALDVALRWLDHFARHPL